MHRKTLSFCGSVLLAIGMASGWAEEKPAEVAAVKHQPKPLSENVNKALDWLAGQQHENGGFGQGGGWRTAAQGGRVEGEKVKDPPDVGNTCMALLTFIRSGSTPDKGPYGKQIAKGLEFVFSQIDGADTESLYVTGVRDTQLQSKIGRYVDTFLAALVLSELKGKMPNDDSEKRLLASLQKTINKIERNQKEDGTFDGNQGWAAVLSQGLGSKAINRARQAGAAVKTETLARDQKNAAQGLDLAKGSFDAPGAPGAPAASSVAGKALATRPDVASRVSARGGLGGAGGAGFADAGVELYRYSAKAGALQDNVNTNRELERKAKLVLESKTATKDEKDAAQTQLKQFADAEKAQQAALGGVVARATDKRFVAGFGNNGGEEFLSFMNISEMLLVKGGPEGEKWDKSVTDNLNRVQNADGSWSGHHCITGRTFCTSAALLTLMADRAPIPAAKSEAKPESKPETKAETSK